MEQFTPQVESRYSNHTDSVNNVCFSPDQKYLCSVGDDQTVILTDLHCEDLKNPKILSMEGHTNYVWSSSFTSNGRLLGTSSSDQTVRIWDISDGENPNCATTLRGHECEILCSCFFHNENKIISCGHHQSIKIWDVERKKEYFSMIIDEKQVCVEAVDILPDNREMATGDTFDKVSIIDVRSGKILKTMRQPKGIVRSVQFHPESFLIACGSSTDNAIRIFDRRTYKILQEYHQHESCVNSICFHHSGKFLISGSEDSTIKIFNLEEKTQEKALYILKEHKKPTYSVSFSPDGRYFASGNFDEDIPVYLWNFPLGNFHIRKKRDIDEEERWKYLLEKMMFVPDEDEEVEEKYLCVKIRFENLPTLSCYKSFL